MVFWKIHENPEDSLILIHIYKNILIDGVPLSHSSAPRVPAMFDVDSTLRISPAKRLHLDLDEKETQRRFELSQETQHRRFLATTATFDAMVARLFGWSYDDLYML